MASSGTVATTSVEVATLIDQAFRRAGKLASTVSGELLMSARQDLFFLLTDLSNRGLNLWCVQKHVINLIGVNKVYTLPSGTVDLLNLLHRTSTPIPLLTTTFTPTRVSVALTQPGPIHNIALKLGSASAQTLAVEVSDDSVTWYPLETFTTQADIGDWVCQDIDNPGRHLFWSVKAVIGVLPVISEARFNGPGRELSVDQMNRDDYVSLPSKGEPGAANPRSYQYWFDKQIKSRVWVWPMPVDDSDQLVAWVSRQVQDVGALSGTLDVPQRWYESVIFSLACRVALTLPPAELPPGRLEYLTAKADEHLWRAEFGESDGAPMRLAPRIGRYTR